MMRSLSLFVSLAVLALFTSGCTTAYFSVPNQRFDSPVVSGQPLKGSVGLGYENPNFIVTVKDITDTPPSNSGSEITKDPKGLNNSEFDHLFFDLHLGLHKRLEISRVGNLFHLKYQFLGSPRIESKAGEFVAAITADLFRATHETSTNISGAKLELDAEGTGASIIFGYRGEKDMIYYLNVNYLDFEADTTITQSTQTYKYNDNGDQLGASIGLRYEQSPNGLYANIEWSYTKTSWADLDEKEWGSAGVILGLSW